MRVRTFALAALAAAGTLPALAADYPVLRGTTSPTLPPIPELAPLPAADWNGYYIGGLASMGSFAIDPRTGSSDLAARVLRNTTIETQYNASRLIQPAPFSLRGAMFGGFAGYNAQFEEAVVGLEVDYLRFGKAGSSTDTIARQFPNSGNFVESVNMTGGNTTRIDHLVTLRARAGYAMGNIMPFVTGGLALGHGTVSNFVTITAQGQAPDPTQPPSSVPYLVNYPTVSSTRTNAFMMGFTGGAGVEAMFGGLILRGEYLFTRLQAQGGAIIDINQARVGAGVKF